MKQFRTGLVCARLHVESTIALLCRLRFSWWVDSATAAWKYVYSCLVPTGPLPDFLVAPLLFPLVTIPLYLPYSYLIYAKGRSLCPLAFPAVCTQRSMELFVLPTDPPKPTFHSSSSFSLHFSAPVPFLNLLGVDPAFKGWAISPAPCRFSVKVPFVETLSASSLTLVDLFQVYLTLFLW